MNMHKMADAAAAGDAGSWVKYKLTAYFSKDSPPLPLAQVAMFCFKRPAKH